MGRPSYYIRKIRQFPAQTILREFKWKIKRQQRQLSFLKQIASSPPIISAEHGRQIIGDQGLYCLPPFFFNKDKAAYQKTLKSYFPSQQIIKEADTICDRHFYILGRQADLSQGIDWQRDFFNGYCWNNKKQYFPAEEATDLTPRNGADIKVPWELSRLQFSTILGQAYWLTEDEKYARIFVDLLKHWIAKNPPYKGINWCSPMEVGIRATNLIWGIYFFIGSKTLNEDFTLELISLLEWHGQFIYANLEKWFESTGNHYIANLAGLIYLGIFLGKQSWLDFALSELTVQGQEQILDDGTSFESSTSYHRLVLELLFYPAWLCRINNINLPESFWEALRKMFSYTNAYLKPNEQAPQLGDNDNGRLHYFDNRSTNDHSYLPAIANLAFGESYPHSKEIPLETLWLFGPQILAEYQKRSVPLHEKASSGFSQAGVYIMRSQKVYMIINCGPNGFYDKGCHAHNDKLSFELNYKGKDFIVDPGCYCYTPDVEERNRFRSTAYHNTVRVDKEEQNRFEPGQDFFLHPDSHPKILKWQVSPEQDIFHGQHDGYARLQNSVTHQRQIVFDKSNNHWEITDSLQGHGEHLLEWYLHLAPDVETKLYANNEVVLKNQGVKLVINTPQQAQLLDTYYSPEYGMKVPTTSLYWSLQTKLPVNLQFSINGNN